MLSSGSQGMRRMVVPALAVIVIVLTVLTINSSRANQQEFDREIDAAVDRVRERVDARLQRGRLAAESLRGVFEASDDVRAGEFKAFSDTLFASDTLAGVTALGYSPRVARGDIPALEAAVRVDTSANPDGNPDFEVRPPVTDPDADVVIYAEPEGSQAAIGFNLASNPSRRQALDTARDTGQVISTEPIVLVQEEGDSAAVIIYAAVYAGEETPQTLEARRDAYVGSVSVILRSEDFIQPVIDDSRLDVTLYDPRTADVAGTDVARTVHDLPEPAMLLPDYDAGSRISLQRVIEAPGRQWILLASATADRPAAVDPSVLLPRLLPLFAVVGLFLILGRSERRALEEARAAAKDLRKSQARLGALVASSPDGLLLLDTDGRVEFSSDVADQLLSPDGDPITGADISGLLFEADGRDLSVAFEDVEHGRVEFEGRSRSGGGVDLAAVRFDVDQVMVAVRDATARIHTFDLMERAVVRERSATDRERELADSRRVLLSTVSHELKTPLTAILGFASLLKSHVNAEDPTLTDCSERIIRNARTLVSLVDDLVAFSRLERDDFTLAPFDLDAGSLVEEITDSMRPIMEQHTMTVSSESVVASLDRTAVTRIVSNLLTNAARYTPKGTDVAVEVLSAGPDVVISVDDGGPGIPERERGKVFERYERGSTGIAATSAGTGVGLWVVRELARRMNGDVTLGKSHLGGARFVVTLTGAVGSRPEPASDTQFDNRKDTVSP